MFRALPVLLIFIVGSVSCRKAETRVCECRTASGEVHSSRSATSKDRDVIQQFEKECDADGVMTVRTNGATSTSTFVPCTLK